MPLALKNISILTIRYMSLQNSKYIYIYIKNKAFQLR